MKILFLLGWHSVPGGVKPNYLKDADHEVINPALDDDDFTLAVRTAQAEYDQHQPDMVVGSSRGGAVAMNIESKDTPLVLLCPAWKNWGTATQLKPNSAILHSRQDDVIPFADSEELVADSGLPPETLIEIGNDHRLADPEPLEAMLEACERLAGNFKYFVVSSLAGTPVVRFKDLAAVIRDREGTCEILHLAQEMKEVVERAQWQSAILDFEGKVFAPCHAFQLMLIDLHKKLGDRLKLCHLPPVVTKHFEMNHLADLLNIYPTPETAINDADAIRPS